VRFIGERTRIPEKLQMLMRDLEQQSAAGTEGTFVVALSYGGRAEIVSAVNALLASGKEQVTEQDFRDTMWSAGLADPDLIIRTGGDKRLSNFLTWQSVYSELFLIDTKWPDFSKEELAAILEEYAARERRHGK
jgi:undecaprenyl diphosphate synthase